MEVWAVIKYYGGYEVSNMGRVRNRRTKRILTTNPTKSHRHPQVFLQVCKGYKNQITLSRLVYDTFCLKDGWCSGANYWCEVKGHRIGHKDGNILNNRADNLYAY